MTTQRKYEILGAVITLLLAICFLRAWVQEREYRIRAEVTGSAQEEKAKADEQTVAAQTDAIKARDKANDKLTSTLTAQAAALATPQQAAKVIVSYLPAQIATPIPVVPRDALPAAIAAELPHDASPTATVGIVTDKQLVQIGKDNLAANVCRQDLLTCNADKVSLGTIVTAKSDEVTAKTTQVAALEVALKGGTKWQRVGKVLKYAGCAGLGAGAGAGLATVFKAPTIGATIGGTTGVLTCAAFTK